MIINDYEEYLAKETTALDIDVKETKRTYAFITEGGVVSCGFKNTARWRETTTGIHILRETDGDVHMIKPSWVALTICHKKA